MILRPYQQAAIDAVYEHLRTRDDNPCAVIPTAGGKTPIMATICRDAVVQWNGRVLILAHVKELLEQTADKLRAVCPDVDFGIYSAGLKRRDTNNPIIVAGIQSVYRRACELEAFDLVMVDEAHLIPLDGDGMYRQFLADAKVVNPNLRVIGFTATPYRLKSGSICTPDGFLNQVCYEVGVLGPFAQWPHQWFWDGHEHVDPAKEANAQATRLASHTTTLADEYARRGLDWETQLRQRAKEFALMNELGLTATNAQPSTSTEDTYEGDEADEEVPANRA